MWKLAALCSIHVIGDWGRRGQFQQRQIASKMREIPHDAVISVGDNFYPDGIETNHDPHIYDSWASIYDTESPWYVALGNHDHRGNATAQTLIELTNWNMPSTVYDFTLCNHTFVVMDSTVISGQQWQHVDFLLKKASGRPKWIVAHHPVFTAGWHNNVDQLYVDKMSELYHKHDVQGILSGHDHNLQFIDLNGLRQVVSGSGSSAYHVVHDQPGLQFFKAEAGFMNIEIRKETVDIRFIGANGTLFRTEWDINER